MYDKTGPMQMGINLTDDIRFNFTAPYMLIEVLICKLVGDLHFGEFTGKLNTPLLP